MKLILIYFDCSQGIMSSSIAYYIQGLMMQRKGPVFVTAFNPLVVVIVSIMSFFVLGQGTYLGGCVNNNLFIMIYTWFSFGYFVLINLTKINLLGVLEWLF